MSESSEYRKKTDRQEINSNSSGFFSPQENILHKNLDSACLYTFEDKTFIRIEYPGLVRNVDKAIESLGGIDGIQKAAEGKKLELSFHPRSPYMKGCVSDADHTMGLIVKVKKDNLTREFSYEVIGASVINFKFNRMVDFQYLPLVAKDKPEHKDSEVEYVYNKIILEKMPTLKWFTSKETSNNPLFLICGSFARFDQPQSKFHLNSAEFCNSLIRKDAPPLTDFGQRKMHPKMNTLSIRVIFTKDTKVPYGPLPGALDNVKTKFLQQQLENVKALFEERPISTKPAIMHKTGINIDSIKVVLPCVAYYCSGGPWRTCWIKFGYDPRTDLNSRIYQILDFRIRQGEGMKTKIKTKRSLCNNIPKKLLKKQLGDTEYIIRVNQIPPARQMLYQYCDILLPEVQEMLSKLPKLPATAKLDFKNGWLPWSFQDQCREILNRYVFEAVQKEMLKESKSLSESPENITNYCSKMLSNIKKGFTQSIGEYSHNQANVIEQIDLRDDEDDDDDDEDDYDDEIYVKEVIMGNLPETLPDEGNEDSDLDIDLEIIEEVNQIVSESL